MTTMEGSHQMKHINHESTTRTGMTPTEWLPVGAAIAELANDWAVRTDLITFVGEGATEGLAPALFKPAIAEIEISVEQAFGFGVTPEHIGDLRDSKNRYEFPVATGAIIHEALHARFSRWSLPAAIKELKEDEYQALNLLEEGRIEALGVQIDPKHKAFLRASALKLAIGDLDLDTLSDLSVSSAAKLVALINARVIGGILTPDEVTEVTQIVRLHLGELVFIRLLEIIDEFQKHTNHWDISGAYPLAIEWAKIVRERAEERGEEPDSEQTGGEPSEMLQELLDKLEEAAETVAIANFSELYDQQEDEEWEQIVKEQNSDKSERDEHREVSSEVFSKGTSEVAGNGTASRLVEQRKPEGKERSAAVTVSRMLEAAKYRERDITKITSQLPQGKLRFNAAVHNEALRSRGLLPTANEWKRKVRKHTDEPKLSVGVMVDISGSMRPAMEAMATTAWVMSEAVRRVQGKCAMVYYGQDVFPTLKSGQHLNTVNVWTASDPTEKFDKAFKALDGSLNLLHTDGARLLVVVSDGVYTEEETRKAHQWLRRCDQAGVAVLWLTFDHNGHYASRISKATNTVVLSGRLDPADAAVEIGKAAAKALEMTNKAVA